jgi:hypothetical protein
MIIVIVSNYLNLWSTLLAYFILRNYKLLVWSYLRIFPLLSHGDPNSGLDSSLPEGVITSIYPLCYALILLYINPYNLYYNPSLRVMLWVKQLGKYIDIFEGIVIH